MSFLQQRPPSEAVQEILRERRAAIESGKLKGRRLFEAGEGAAEMGFDGREEICIGFFDLVRGSGVRSVSRSSYGSRDVNDNFGSKEKTLPSGCHCCSNSGSSLRDDKIEREEVVEGDKVEFSVGVGEKKYDGLRGSTTTSGKWMFLMGCFAVALVAFALAIFLLRCNEGFGYEDEVILVPT